MRLLSLCTGIGGIDLAAEWAGMEVVGQIEIDPFCQTVLEKHWPHVKRLSDIREVQGDEFGPIDIMAGGIPCQPFSVAGKRTGQQDNRYLWPEMLRLVEICQPAWVCVENVTGFISLALDAVLVDLEARGYEARAVVLPACAVGAPHLRERVFVLAHARCQRQSTRRAGGRGEALGEILNLWTSDSNQNVDDPQCLRRDRGQGMPIWSDEYPQEWQGPEATTRSQAAGARAGVGQADPKGTSTKRLPSGAQPPYSRPSSTGEYWGDRDGQIESSMGRVFDGIPSRLDRHWPTGPEEAQHSWEPPRTTQERIPNRSARLKALGNAVVPQQIYPIFAAIMSVSSF